MRFGLVPPRHKITGCLLRGSLFTEILCILLDEGNAAGKNWVNKSTGNGSKMHERLWSMDSKCPFVGSHICTVGFLRGYLHDLACWLIWPETSNFELHQTEEAEFDTTACKQAWALLLLCSTKTSDILYSASLAFSFFFLLFIDVSSSPVTLAYFVSYSLNFSSLGLSGDCRKITLSW